MNYPAFVVPVLFFCVSILLVFDLIWLLLKTPLVFFFKDKPGIRKIHQRSIPRAGGICILVSFCIMLFIWNAGVFAGLPRLSTVFLNVLLLVTTGIFLVGFFDDTTSFVILNKAKFILEFLIAAGVVFLLGIRFPQFDFFGVVSIKNEFLLGMFSIFWIVGVANALNIIDGIDGLAGAFAVISFSTVAVLAMHSHFPDVAFLCFIIAGCIVGFLLHNVSPARVFLGDTGSLFLGMLLSVALMYMISGSNNLSSISTAFLIAGFPIIDVSVAMIRRFVRARIEKKPWIQCIRAVAVADNEHTHHRLVYRGMNHTQATLIIATLSATLCVIAIHINLYEEFKYALLAYSTVVVLWFLYELNFFDRIILRIRFLLHRKLGKSRYRIGVMDADPIMHHALINFRQTKFVFDFFSCKELETRNKIQELQLDATENSNDQFLASTEWARDTRRFSREMINEVISEWTKNAAKSGNDPQADPPKKSETISFVRPHNAILINCRKESEIKRKTKLGLQLLKETHFPVILIMDHDMEMEFYSNTPTRELIFVRKPFYIPVFLSELLILAKQWQKWENAEDLFKSATILKKMGG